MRSVCSTMHVAVLVVPPWKHNTKLSLSYFSLINNHFVTFNGTKLITSRANASSKDDPSSSPLNQSQGGYDPSEDLFGLDVDLQPRDVKSDASEPRSWFGPNGQYIRELPCPTCRGRGYTPCTECGIERSRQDCSLCSGKGIVTCRRCQGERVIWEESIDEKPWEKARSISPFKVKEDDEVDDLDLKLDVKKKSKRVYGTPSPEVVLKISRSLKSLNAKTGLFSKRMKLIHGDPTLRAQRVAAIKKAKGTAAARKHTSESLKAFFSNPENRRKRSIAMKGVKFFCKNCGREGHRTHYCPELGETADRRFRCSLCGERGHNKTTCQKPKTNKPKQRVLGRYHCKVCGQVGHNQRTCSLHRQVQSNNSPTRNGGSLGDSKGSFRVPYQCSECGQDDHNKRTCPTQTKAKADDLEIRARRPYKCRRCGANGHNQRTCAGRTTVSEANAKSVNN